jgi:hypothetical protein
VTPTLNIEAAIWTSKTDILQCSLISASFQVSRTNWRNRESELIPWGLGPDDGGEPVCHRCNRGASWEGRRQWELKAYLVWGLWECAMTGGPCAVRRPKGLKRAACIMSLETYQFCIKPLVLGHGVRRLTSSRDQSIVSWFPLCLAHAPVRSPQCSLGAVTVVSEPFNSKGILR